MELTPAQRLLIIALAALTVVRWVIAAHTEITPHEALLHAWGQRPSLAGCEGGGGTAILVRISTAIFGRHEFGVRFFAPLLAAGASIVLYRLAHSLAGEKSAAWAVALVNVTPLWNLGAVFMRPETPAIFLTLCGMSAVWRGLRRASNWAFHWPLAGLCFGLGWLFWYGALAGVAGTFFLLAASRRWRGQLMRPGPWLMLADFAVFVWPVWHWNAQNAWTGWHLWRESAGLMPWRADPQSAAAAWAQWLPACGLVALPLMIRALAGSLHTSRHAPRPDGVVFAAAFALVAIIPAMLLSAGGGGTAGDIAPALPMLAVLLGWWWEQRSENVKARLRWQAACMLSGLVLSSVALQTDLLRRTGLAAGYEHDASVRWRGWRRTAAEAEAIVRESLPQAPGGLVLMAADWRLAAVLNFLLPEELPVFRSDPRQPAVLVLEDITPSSQFSFWPRADTLTDGRSAFAGRTVLLFSDRGLRTTAPPSFHRACDNVRIVSVFDVTRGENLLRRIAVSAGVWKPPEG